MANRMAVATVVAITWAKAAFMAMLPNLTLPMTMLAINSAVKPTPTTMTPTMPAIVPALLSAPNVPLAAW